MHNAGIRPLADRSIGSANTKLAVAKPVALTATSIVCFTDAPTRKRRMRSSATLSTVTGTAPYKRGDSRAAVHTIS
jgi:hypothetical protein